MKLMIRKTKDMLDGLCFKVSAEQNAVLNEEQRGALLNEYDDPEHARAMVDDLFPGAEIDEVSA